MYILLYYDLLGAINILPVLYLNSIVFNVISVNDNLYYFINESKLNKQLPPILIKPTYYLQVALQVKA